MATTSTAEIPLLKRMSAVAAGDLTVGRPRRISPQAGHALELLGHAIEYLADEHLHRRGEWVPEDPQVQAMQLLMALNRQIYFACPEVPTLGERLLSLLHLSLDRH